MQGRPRLSFRTLGGPTRSACLSTLCSGYSARTVPGTPWRPVLRCIPPPGACYFLLASGGDVAPPNLRPRMTTMRRSCERHVLNALALRTYQAEGLVGVEGRRAGDA